MLPFKPPTDRWQCCLFHPSNSSFIWNMSLKWFWITTPMLNGMDLQWKHAGLERHWDFFSISTLMLPSEENWDCNPLKVIFHAEKQTADFCANGSQWQSKHREQDRRERLPTTSFFLFEFLCMRPKALAELGKYDAVKGRVKVSFHVWEGVYESRERRNLFSQRDGNQQVNFGVYSVGGIDYLNRFIIIIIIIIGPVCKTWLNVGFLYRLKLNILPINT